MVAVTDPDDARTTPGEASVEPAALEVVVVALLGTAVVVERSAPVVVLRVLELAPDPHAAIRVLAKTAAQIDVLRLMCTSSATRALAAIGDKYRALFAKDVSLRSLCPVSEGSPPCVP